MTDWCILRCSGSSTLRLAASLTEAGFEVYCPVETIQRRAPRSHKMEARREALISQIVFARFERLIDLVTLSRSPSLSYRVWDGDKRRMVTKGHPSFHVMRDMGSYATVRDRGLDHLRVAEQTRAPLPEAKRFKVGDRVKLVDAGFEGLTGTVASVKGKRAMVSFPDSGFLRDASFPMSVLLDANPLIKVQPFLSEQAQTAKAA